MSKNPTTWAATLCLTVATAAAWFGVAVATSPRTALWWLSTGIGLMFVLPLVMALAMTLAGAFLAVVVTAIAVLASPWRRGGLGELNRELLGKGWGIVPEYVEALRRVRSRMVWSAVLGSLLAWVVLAVGEVWGGPGGTLG